jgi:hypothetical protein
MHINILRNHSLTTTNVSEKAKTTVLTDAVDKLKRKITQLQDQMSESVLKPAEDKSSETIIVEVQVSKCNSCFDCQ